MFLSAFQDLKQLSRLEHSFVNCQKSNPTLSENTG